MVLYSLDKEKQVGKVPYIEPLGKPKSLIPKVCPEMIGEHENRRYILFNYCYNTENNKFFTKRSEPQEGRFDLSEVGILLRPVTSRFRFAQPGVTDI